MIRITASGSLIRISIRFERPTVSIQNGRATCRRISSESASSRSEKNGFGPGGGSVSPFRNSTSRTSRSAAMRDRVSALASCG